MLSAFRVSLVALGLAIPFVCCGGTTVSTDGGTYGGGDGATGGDGSTIGDGATAACAGPGTCALRSPYCCGTCQAPKLADFVPIPVSQLADYDKTHCNPAPPCAPCVDPPDPTRGGSFQSLCRGGQCTVVDMRTEPVSACTSDADCVLRASDCCECGSRGWVALAQSQLEAYTALLCAATTPCPDCMPVPPTGIRAACDAATHHCVAVAVDAGH